jgi:hypothetical protein
MSRRTPATYELLPSETILLEKKIMTQKELAAYKAETDAINKRTEAMRRETEILKEQTAKMAAQNECMAAQAERSIALQARRTYQSEIHGVAINVLVSILTKDALRAMRDSEFSAAKIDVGEIVEYSLIVGKRYVDELHRILVSEKQIVEYKDQLAIMTPSLPVKF